MPAASRRSKTRLCRVPSRAWSTKLCEVRMISVHVNFYQRICLWNICGNAQVGNLKDAAPYLRLIEKLRPSDEEMMETQFRMEERMGYVWRAPSAGYGDRDIELEADEQARLTEALENQQQVKVADAAWQFKLLDQIKPAAKPEPMLSPDGTNTLIGTQSTVPA